MLGGVIAVAVILMRIQPLLQHEFVSYQITELGYLPDESATREHFGGFCPLGLMLEDFYFCKVN
jgi:hypothetical protein